MLMVEQQFIFDLHTFVAKHKAAFVAITRFLGGTLDQNFMGGGTKTFKRTGHFPLDPHFSAYQNGS